MSLQNLPVDKIKKVLIENGVSFAAIFGSHAKGTATPQSDVDILIEYKKDAAPGLFKFIGLAQHLEDILGKKVDLVTKDALNKYVKNEVLSSMQPFYDGR
jgi:hypothetical protein